MVVALRAGVHKVGPDSGTVLARTYREGLAQKAGHDLIIEVGQWSATVVIGDGRAVVSRTRGRFAFAARARRAARDQAAD